MAEQSLGQNEPPSHHGGLENLDTEHSYWIEEFDVSKAEASAVGSILAATVSLFGKCCIQSSGME